MFWKYFRNIAINLALVVGAFLVFVFLDVNLIRAKTIGAEKVEAVAKVEPIETSRESLNRDNVFFNWDGSHYREENLPNFDTNTQRVSISQTESTEIAFYSQKKAYYRFEVSQFVLSGKINPARCFVRVYKDDEVVPPLLANSNIPFQRENGKYTAFWFTGIKPLLGDYKAVLYVDNNPIKEEYFRLISRPPLKMKKLMTFINLEENAPVVSRTVMSPKNQKISFTNGLYDWMDFGEIDGFLTLTGETTGWTSVTPDKPWEHWPLKNLEILGPELKKRNKLVGAYIMCFYTPKAGWKKGGYQSGIGINGKTSEFISIRDEKRFNDTVELARQLNALDHVDFIGFDFIRLGENVGYENVDEFVREMNVSVPANWWKMSFMERVNWLGNSVKFRGNQTVIKQWRNWMTHKIAEWVYRVRIEAELTKPIWVFTLGWDHGIEHGQDPYLFQDAGTMADFVMLYEATPQMFGAMDKSWKDYLKDEELNYVAGNQLDHVVNKSMHGRNPVEEYTYRLDTGVNYASYRAKGIFIHDFGRAFWGRRGGYDGYQWISAGLKAIANARYQNKETPIKLSIAGSVSYTADQSAVYVPVKIDIAPEFVESISQKELQIEGIGNNFNQKVDISKISNIILSVKMNPKEGSVQYLGLKAKIDGYPASFDFAFVKLVLTAKKKPS